MVNNGLQPLCVFLAIFPSAVCVLIVTTRVVIRLRERKYSIDDTLLVVATMLNIVLSCTTCGYIYSSCYGYHTHDIPKSAVDPIVAMKWNYANSVIYNPILALVKASFLLTLIKLQSQKKWIDHCLWTALAISCCFAIAAPIACMLQCNPIPKYWDRSIPGYCVDAGAYTISTASVVLATDVLILVMPSWIIHSLRMSLGRKLMAIGVLSIGIAVTIVGVVRTSVLVKVFVLREVVPDPTYGLSYTLSNLESSLAIVGACGPTIRHMLGFCLPSRKAVENTSNRHLAYPTNETPEGNRANQYVDGSIIFRFPQKSHEEDFGEVYDDKQLCSSHEIQRKVDLEMSEWQAR